MSYDPRDTLDERKNNPNQGMHAKSYIAIVVAAVILLLGVILLFALRPHATDGLSGKPNPPAAAPSGPSPQ